MDEKDHKDHLHNILNEKFILEKVNHPFISNLEYAFEEDDKVCFVMNVYSGGDLYWNIQ